MGGPVDMVTAAGDRVTDQPDLQGEGGCASVNICFGFVKKELRVAHPNRNALTCMCVSVSGRCLVSF